MTMTRTSGERMAILETKVDDIKRDIGEIKDILKGSDSKYATKVELELLRSEINTSKQSNRSWIQWAIPLGVTVLNIIITLLIIKLQG